MKTAISIPDPVFRRAEKLARKLRVSRSELYTKAVHRYMQQQDEEDITRRLNDLYTEQSSELDPVLQSIQSRSVGKSSWK